MAPPRRAVVWLLACIIPDGGDRSGRPDLGLRSVDPACSIASKCRAGATGHDSASAHCARTHPFRDGRRLTIGNPPDWTGEPLARLPRLVVQVDVWAHLRHGQMIVPLVALERPQVTATQLANGAANYKLQLANSSGGGARIGEVRVDDAQARIRLARLKADVTIGIATQDQGGQAQLVADARGTYNAQPITGHMVGGALLSLQDKANPGRSISSSRTGRPRFRWLAKCWSRWRCREPT